MIERIALVVSTRAGHLQLRPERQACTGCESGCGGRCQLLPLSSDGSLALPELAAFHYREGQRVEVSIEDAELARAAWRGYGVVLLGLLVGALVAAGLAQTWLPVPWRDAATLLGLLAGTFLAARLSKRQRIEPRLRLLDPLPAPDAPSISPLNSESDRP